MKKFLIGLNIVIWSFVGYQVSAFAEEAKPATKKACVTQVDPKTKKEKEVCKTVKVHKKHEGTKVEGATKDKK